MEWIVAVVLVVLVFAIAYALYTRQGSGISRHPVGEQNPVEHPDRDDRLEQPGVDESEGTPLDQKGTDSHGSGA